MSGPVWLAAPFGALFLVIGARGFWLLRQGRDPGFVARVGWQRRRMGSGGQRFSSAVFALIGVFLLLVVLDYALGSVGTRRISVASMNYSIGRSTTTYFITTTDGHQYQVAWSVYRVAQPGELLNCKVTTYPALLLSRVDACTATGG